ncbi:MAG: nitroreductase family protein [Rhizobiales bacterium]|nr:nitroreductase family protein [Hyphomicrobiales bacterium]MBI3672029.1 nitroreductase family protein [Hyphomicrobiales bacterium]
MTQPTVLQAIYGRRAVRNYAEDRVGADAVKTLLRAAVQAPTAMHLEPWAFVVVQDVGVLKRLSDKAKSLMLAQAAGDEYRLAAGHSPVARGASALLGDPAFNIFYDASTLIVILGKPLGRFVVADCWLAAQNLMLAAHASGLATCPIGFAVSVLNDPEVKAELKIPADITAIAPIILGVARGAAPPVTRKEPEILNWL